MKVKSTISQCNLLKCVLRTKRTASITPQDCYLVYKIFDFIYNAPLGDLEEHFLAAAISHITEDVFQLQQH